MLDVHDPVISMELVEMVETVANQLAHSRHINTQQRAAELRTISLWMWKQLPGSPAAWESIRDRMKES